MEADLAVELQGDLVAVEPLERRHAAGILAAADSDEVFAWLPYPRPQDLGEAEAWIDAWIEVRAAGTSLPFAILTAEEGEVIGSTSFLDHDPGNRKVEIGSTWFARSSWRSGRNLETKLLLMTHAFETLGLERVSFQTDNRNERSQRAIAGLGASREGVLRHDKLRRDGSWRDSVHFSILRGEWDGVKRGLRERLDRFR